MSRPDPLPHLARLAAALEAEDQPTAGFAVPVLLAARLPDQGRGCTA